MTGDRTHSSRANRQAARGERIRATIPERNDQIADRRRRGSHGGRPFAFDRAAYRRRNQVERGFNRRKHRRGVATRFDKLGAHYLATLDLRWWRAGGCGGGATCRAVGGSYGLQLWARCQDLTLATGLLLPFWRQESR